MQPLLCRSSPEESSTGKGVVTSVSSGVYVAARRELPGAAARRGAASLPNYGRMSSGAPVNAFGEDRRMCIDVWRLSLALLWIAVLGTAGCQASPSQSSRRDDRHSLDDIGRHAVLTATHYVEAQRQLRLDKPEEAMKIIDSEYPRLLYLLREFNPAIEQDYRFSRLRDKVVTELQTRWLKEPPMYLDDLSAEYLERTCAAIAGCPRGRVRPLKEAPVPPESESQ
jgi:hypothetical protein